MAKKGINGVRILLKLLLRLIIEIEYMVLLFSCRGVSVLTTVHSIVTDTQITSQIIPFLVKLILLEDHILLKVITDTFGFDKFP